jgi:F-type H+-transporting ATPase subunit delta
MTGAEAALARRYAQALFEASRSRGLEEKIGADLVSVRELAEGEESFVRFLASPEVRDRDKSELVETVLGSKVELLIVRFLRLVVDHKRGALVAAMCTAYADLLEAHRGLLRIQVRVAQPLEPAQAERLRAVLAKRTGRDVVLETEVDPSLLGGVVTRLRDRVLDGSVRRQLDEMREAMLAAR